MSKRLGGLVYYCGTVRYNIVYCIYVYNSTVRVFITDLLNAWADLNAFFCMKLSDALDGSDSRFLK
jgi:hypothetical protein